MGGGRQSFRRSLCVAVGPADKSLPATLTQFLGNSGIFLFIHKTEPDVLIIEIFQDLGSKLRRTEREKTELWASVTSDMGGPILPPPLTSWCLFTPAATVTCHISEPQMLWITRLALSKSEWNWSQQLTGLVAAASAAWTQRPEEQEGWNTSGSMLRGRDAAAGVAERRAAPWRWRACSHALRFTFVTGSKHISLIKVTCKRHHSQKCTD